MTSARRDYARWDQRTQQSTRDRLALRRRLGLGRAAPTPPARPSTFTIGTPISYYYDPARYTTYFDNGWTLTDRQLAGAAWNWGQFTTATTTAATSLQNLTYTFQNWATTMATTFTSNIIWPTYSYTDQTYWAGWNTAYVETAEQRLARETRQAQERVLYEQRQREHRARIEAAAAEEARADARARELLLAHLSAQQKRDLLEHRWFDVIGSRGRRWRIHTRGYAGNIDLMPERGEVRLASYCAHSYEHLPLHDHWLIQKIVLEADEDAFIAVANLAYTNPEVAREQIPNRRWASVA